LRRNQDSLNMEPADLQAGGLVGGIAEAPVVAETVVAK
jgi:hypothetical protein